MSSQLDTSDGDYTLYLVQRDITAKDKKGRPRFVGLIGCIKASRAGYEFIPHTTSRKPSRKLHPTCEKAIPAWAQKAAERRGYPDLLTHTEFVAAQKAAQTPVGD